MDEALQEYHSTVRDFPRDVVARTGRAEVLKALGRLDEALQEYDSTVRDFPHNVVARNGRAEVLKALGRLDEAFQEYDSTVRDFPHNVVARTGRAEVLKAQGSLEGALQEYEHTLQVFPNDAVARNGKASVLVLLERCEEALTLLPETTPRTESDWVAFHIRGMIALKRGDLGRAIEIFERGIRENPWVLNRSYFSSALAVARLRKKEFRQAAESVAEDLTPISDVVRIHAFGALGESARAQKACDRLQVFRLPILVVLREALSERYLSRAGAPVWQSDDWIFDQECRLLLVA
jgi:tetratricopeptide (TPR) repeat protein